MASRRMMGYGSSRIERAPKGGFPIPPPPDGSVPSRLPVGANMEQPQEPAAPMGEPDSEDAIMQLMKMLGRLDGA